MPKLPESEIEKIISLLQEGKSLPEDYREDLIQQLEQLKRSLLFDTKKEYELIYADKEREVDILADTMAVPLQKVKTFRNGANGDEWTKMYRQPDKLLAAMDTILPILMRRIGAIPKTGENNLVFLGPHRGAEGFMSLQQFDKFYWPGLKAVLLGLIEGGLTPCILWEGDYTSRLNYLLELPPGKIINRFNRTNIYKAREVLGKHHCIAGGMLPSLLQIGGVQKVKDECKRLIETVGRDGGYIMGHSTPLDEARIENVRAMIAATREYGVYR